MEIFKLLESTMANVQPGHSMKHLRRDQLLDNYEAASKTLQTLMKAKESEIAHRKDLIKMLEDSKSYHDNRLSQAKQEYQIVKSHIPEGVDMKSIQIKSEPTGRSTTPPMPPPASLANKLPPPPIQPLAPIQSLPPQPPQQQHHQQQPSALMAGPGGQQPMQISYQYAPAVSHSSINDSAGSHDQNKSSLDRRLSEFLRTFPNLTQAGAAAPTTGPDPNLQQQQQTIVKPAPGYYTQQQPMVAPMQMLATAPPSMELLRFPPPNMMPPGTMGLPLPQSSPHREKSRR